MRSTLLIVSAVLLGLTVGLLFGWIQAAAGRRHERLQSAGRLSSGWALVPGSFRRVAYLLIALVVIQVGCPLMFARFQWFVSGGLALGYGWTLLQELRRRQTANG